MTLDLELKAARKGASDGHEIQETTETDSGKTTGWRHGSRWTTHRLVVDGAEDVPGPWWLRAVLLVVSYLTHSQNKETRA